MEIKRETTVMVLTTDGKEIHKGDYVAFNASGRCLAGHFAGISKKGALIFESVISETNVTFHVMPKCIETIIRLQSNCQQKVRKRMRFKAGDKVRVKKFKKRPSTWNGEGKMDHLMGKVVKIERVVSPTKCVYAVHDSKNDYDWFFKEDDLEPVNETIVIYRKDRKVIAVDKTTGYKAIARCNPADEYDFRIGAKLAFERLMNGNKENITVEDMRKAPKLYNGKIVFTKGDSIFKTGHIYEVKDGRINTERYGQVPTEESFKDIEDVKDYFTGNCDGNRKRKIGWATYTLELMEVKED